MKNSEIFVACDTSNLLLVKKIIKHTKTKKLNIIPKFGKIVRCEIFKDCQTKDCNQN